MEYFDKKIVTLAELRLIWWVDGNTLKKRIQYNLWKKKLFQIRRGLYSFPGLLGKLDTKEAYIIANSIYSPSYISFNTALSVHAVIFQWYGRVFVASTHKKELYLENIDLKIEFSRIPKGMLFEPIGISHKNGYSMAWPERAIADTIYRSGPIYFDRLEGIDWSLLRDISHIYGKYNKRTEKDILSFIKSYGKLAIKA